jgi:precorrin-6Y C5,15-methyltransferase (decarboxylating)
VCIVSGESIAVEAALIASEGTILAVEYDRSDRETMEGNIQRFGLNNITIIDHVDDETMKGLPVPSLCMLVASASMEQEIACLLRLNPHMEFVIYTLDFRCAAAIPDLFQRCGIRETEVIQLTVSKLTPKHTFETEPAPWLIYGRA